jgi:hypothetical protein
VTTFPEISEAVHASMPPGDVAPAAASHELTEHQRELLALISELGPSSSLTLQAGIAMPVTYPQLMRNLSHLQTIGLVEKVGAARATRWRLPGQTAPLPATGQNQLRARSSSAVLIPAEAEE